MLVKIAIFLKFAFHTTSSKSSSNGKAPKAASIATFHSIFVIFERGKPRQYPVLDKRAR